MHLLQANNLEGYANGDTPCSSKTTGSGDASQPNPAYKFWCRQDNHVSLALLGSYSPDAQIVVSSTTSSTGAWQKLQKAYANRSHARIMSLKERLSSITKGTSSVHDYLRNIRSIADELALIGHPVDDIDLVIAALNGLGPTFREFSASICTLDSPLQFDELFDKLVDFEIFLNREELIHSSVPTTANLANKSSMPSNQGRFPRGPPTMPRKATFDSAENIMVCQFCDKRGHNAK
ncbi:uncharacterized protein LOC109812297 [Cajanus cajan]|nr:uncharacterized protein LOC109812297 [Cajanus cajan]